MAEQIIFTALERKEIKQHLAPRELLYVETLEAIAKEADMLMQSHEEIGKRRMSLGRVLSIVNFMQHA